MAAPLRAVRPGDAISAAKFNEVVDALNALGQLTGVYPIEVQQDAAGVRIGIARQFKAWLFRVQSVPSVVPRTSDNVPYYNATRLRLDSTDTYVAQTPQNVQLYDPLAKDAVAKILTEGTWVLASFDADIGRWQIVRDPFLGTTIVRFRLTATLSLGGTAAAVIQQWNPAAGGGAGAYVDAAAITVVDYFGAIGGPGEWQALNGYYGYAALLPDKNEYQILYMEHVAEFAAFTLTGNMTTGSATATFDSFWRGRSVGGDGFVYDRQNLYASARTGDKGIACWDPSTTQYVIVDMGRSSSEPVLFYLNATLAQGGSADATLRVWNVGAGAWQATGADVTVWDSSDLAPPDPLPVSTLGVAFLSSQSGRYEIIALPGSGGPTIVRFKTTTTLALGGTASANVQTWDSGSSAYVDGATITVVDFYGSLGRRGKFQAPSGFYGYAIKFADKNEYQILDMERIALFATATLNENMGATTAGLAGCSFSTIWEGQALATGAASVLDTLSIYGSLKAGDSVMAVWDDGAAAYRIVDAKQPTGAISYARTYTSHTLAATSKSNNHYVECQAVDDITGAGYSSGSSHFNVLLPSPSAATDPNVDSSVVIGYTIDQSGNKVCVTGYLDDARGMIKTWAGAALSIPHGWALCDGSSYGSFTTPDLRTRFILGANPGGSTNMDGNGNTDDVGQSGGTLKATVDPHNPQPTSATSLNLDVSAETASFGQIPPIDVTLTPNMTGFPVANGGPTLPAVLTLATTGDFTLDMDPLTATANYDFPQLEFSTLGKSTKACAVGQGTPDEEGDCSDLTGSLDVTISPNPPTGTVDDSDLDIIQTWTPGLGNNHWHDIPPLPVSGITFSPSTTTIYPTVDIQSYTDVDSELTPNPHTHNTPKLTHNPVYVTNQYYALCYIMRVD
jgi:Phage Tail Collar Domain